jgi:hypothetical protein
MILQSNTKSFTEQRSLLNPDQIESKRFCDIPLSDIGGDEGNG